MQLNAGNLINASQCEDWLAVDIGFSCAKKTTGVMGAHWDKPRCIQYGQLINECLRFVDGKSAVGLIIEAPLSMAFNHANNPTGRKVEKRDGKTRYWYQGLGCSVMTAAGLFLRTLSEANSPAIAYVFEGLVSFKDRATNHGDDAADLIRNRKNIVNGTDLLAKESDRIISLMSLWGGDRAIPGLIST